MESFKKLISWKLFTILLTGSTISLIAIIPYISTILVDLFEKIPEPIPIPLNILLVIQIFQGIIQFAIFIFIGLLLSQKIGFDLPILESFLEGSKVKSYLGSILGIAIILGILVSLIIIGLDFIFSSVGVQVANEITLPTWQGFLASFYGGIGEEITMRFFLMTLFIWVSYVIKKTENNKPTNLGVWLAIILTSILFGIGYLPITALFIQITPLVITRAILLNGIAGIVFGWLYWRKGLEAAMISHFSAYLVLQVIFPLTI